MSKAPGVAVFTALPKPDDDQGQGEEGAEGEKCSSCSIVPAFHHADLHARE